MGSAKSLTISTVSRASASVSLPAINAGMFEPLQIVEPEGTFLYAHYPRPVSGCAAEVSQRIAESVFSALVKATYRGRKLTREEMMGFGNLTFAGGRDTIIHSISSILGYFGRNPAALEFLVRTKAKYPLTSLVSHSFPLKDINKAFEMAEWQGKNTGTAATRVILKL